MFLNIYSASFQVWKAVKFWQIIPEIISEFETPLISRWACLLTTTMTAHSMAFLKDIDSKFHWKYNLQKKCMKLHCSDTNCVVFL